MKKVLIATTFVLFSMVAGDLFAKDGLIVTGTGGTKWCCPGGKKGDGCEKGASTIPDGARCSFASKTVAATAGLVPENSDTPVVPTRAQEAEKVEKAAEPA